MLEWSKFYPYVWEKTNVSENYTEPQLHSLIRRMMRTADNGGTFHLQLHGIHEGNISDGFVTAHKIARRLAKTCERNVTLRYTGLGEWLVGIDSPEHKGGRFGIPSPKPNDIIYNDLGFKSRVGRINTIFGTELLPA